MLTFDEAKHKYFADGIELPSVTTITRFCSADNRTFAGSDPFYRERGTAIHELCTDYDITGDFPIGTGYDGYLNAYRAFRRDYRIKTWDYIEYAMGSLELGFAGTADRIGKIDNDLCIVDIKSSATLNLIALKAQLTGYRKLYGKKCRLFGLQLKKDGTYRFIEVNDAEQLFFICYQLHNLLKGDNT